MTRMDRWPDPTPGRWWVYRVYDPETRALLYVGCTCHPGRRMAQHWHRTWWFQWSPAATRGCAFITWQEYQTQAAAQAAEGIAICQEDPKHNVMDWTWHPGWETCTTGRHAPLDMPGVAERLAAEFDRSAS